MIKAFAPSTLACTALVIGLAASAGRASAGDSDVGPIPPGKPVRSTADTASAGRRPLAVRIAMADRLKTEKPSAPEAAVESPAVAAASQQPATAAAAEQGGQAVQHRDRLLGRVRERIASIAEPSAVASPSPAGTGPVAAPTTPGLQVARPNVPRLQLECEESTVESRRGETVTWRVTVRNTGAAAHGVLVTLYFAEGIEPTTASGHGHKLAAGEVRFNPVETLGPDDTLEVQVTGRAVQPGAVAYRVEVGCREVPGNVAREAVILVRSPAGN